MAALLLAALLQGSVSLIQQAINLTTRKAYLNFSNNRCFFWGEPGKMLTHNCLGDAALLQWAEAVCRIKLKLVCTSERGDVFTEGSLGSTTPLIALSFSKHGRSTKANDTRFWHHLIWVPQRLAQEERDPTSWSADLSTKSLPSGCSTGDVSILPPPTRERRVFKAVMLFILWTTLV